MQNFFKKLGIGYFIAAGAAVLALITAIVFFPTYKDAMATNAASLVPQTIGIFLIAGVVVEAAVLVVPQYRFIHIGAMVMYALALFKEILLIPPLIADEINNVHYQGGNLGTNVFYLVMLVIIVAAAIAAPLVGFYKKEEDVNEDMKIAKGDVLSIVKVAVSGAVVLAAILVSSLVSLDLKKKMNIATGDEWNPITEEIKQAAKDANYTYNPSEVVMKQQTTYDWNDSEMKSVPLNKNRDGHNLVYYFEGAYSEGYQGDYSPTYCYLYLWDDGIFGGTSGRDNVRGYWYNSSLEAAEGQKDCLNMVTNTTNFESIIANDKDGFYSKEAYMFLDMGKVWGQGSNGRSIIMNGYEYYPEVAVFIDNQGEELECYKGQDADISSWVPSRVLSSLDYSSIFIQTDVTWSATNGSVTINYVDGDKNRGISDISVNFTETGEQSISISWKNADGQTFESSVKVNVQEAPAEE
jgi:hypothetical protein